MCGYKCLRVFQIIIAFLNLVVYYGLVITGIVISATDSFLATTDIHLAYIIPGALAMVAVSIGVVQGFCGSIKEDKYCMLVHLVTTSVAGFLLLIIVITSAGFLGSVKDDLQNYCDGKDVPFTTRGLDFYENTILNLSQPEKFCDVHECPCLLSSASLEHKYTKFYNSPTFETRNLFSKPEGNIRFQQCKQFFQTLVTNDKGQTNLEDDQAKLQAFYLMRDMENEFGCAGICVRSNVAIASDSTRTVFQTNFNNNEPSCLEHIKDHAKEALTTSTIFFTIILIYSILTLIVTGCFTCHKDMKFNLVEINWEKRTRRIMERMGLNSNQ